MFFAAILFVGVAICPHIAFSHPSEAIHDPGDEETQGVNFDELDPSFNLTDWLSSYQDTRRHDSPGSPEFDFLNTTSRLDYTSPNDLGASGIPVTTQDIRAFPVYTHHPNDNLEDLNHIFPPEERFPLGINDVAMVAGELNRADVDLTNLHINDSSNGYRNEAALNLKPQTISSNNSSRKRRRSSMVSLDRGTTGEASPKRLRLPVEAIQMVRIPESAFTHLNNWMNVEGPRRPNEAEEYALAIITRLPESTIRDWFRFILGSIHRTESDNSISETFNTSTMISCGLVDFSTPRIVDKDTSVRSQAADLSPEHFAKCTTSPRRQNQPTGAFECTSGCGAAFRRKDDWRRHEEINQPQTVWHCRECLEHPSRRLFKACRRDKMVGHIKKEHPRTPILTLLQKSKVDVAMDFKPKRCGLCLHQFHSWTDRTNHLAGHFLVTEGIPWNLTQWQASLQDDMNVTTVDQESHQNETVAVLNLSNSFGALKELGVSIEPKLVLQRAPTLPEVPRKQGIYGTMAVPQSTTVSTSEPTQDLYQPLIPPDYQPLVPPEMFPEPFAWSDRYVREGLLNTEDIVAENDSVADDLYALLYFTNYQDDVDQTVPQLDATNLEAIQRSTLNGFAAPTADPDSEELHHLHGPQNHSSYPDSFPDAEMPSDLNIRFLLNTSTRELHHDFIRSVSSKGKRGGEMDLLDVQGSKAIPRKQLAVDVHNPRLNSLHPDLISQSEARPTSRERLDSEVEFIYAGLRMVGRKCLQIYWTQASLPVSNRDSKSASDRWQVLIVLHRSLLHQHHDFFMAAQHPSASPALRHLASRYSASHDNKHPIPMNELLHADEILDEPPPGFGEETWLAYLNHRRRIRMASAFPGQEDVPKRTSDRWQNSIDPAHRLPLHAQHDAFPASRYRTTLRTSRRRASAESTWTQPCAWFLRRESPPEPVAAVEDTWIECLGDLGRYRMAIEDEDLRDREIWAGVARAWCSQAASRHAGRGRLYHQLAILAPPHWSHVLYYLYRFSHVFYLNANRWP